MGQRLIQTAAVFRTDVYPWGRVVACEEFNVVKYVIAYGGAALAFFIIDVVWLKLMATSFYREHVGHLMADKVNMGAAGGFYLIYIVGIVVFAVMPAVQSDSWKTALVLGGLLGLIAYGTYDMTNLATLRDWPVSVAVVDMAWGTALTGVSAVAGYFACRAFS